MHFRIGTHLLRPHLPPREEERPRPTLPSLLALRACLLLISWAMGVCVCRAEGGTLWTGQPDILVCACRAVGWAVVRDLRLGREG